MIHVDVFYNVNHKVFLNDIVTLHFASKIFQSMCLLLTLFAYFSDLQHSRLYMDLIIYLNASSTLYIMQNFITHSSMI